MEDNRPSHSSSSGIRDNHTRGKVADFLTEKIQTGSKLSIVSAYFTIYAYEKLKGHLDNIDSLRFLFGEPRFIKSLDPEKTDKKAFKIEDEGLSLANRLQQKKAAKECAEWLTSKVEVRSVVKPNFLHGKLYHIAHNGVDDAILGSSNFTTHGLGLGDSIGNIELNMIVDSRRDLDDLKRWFDEVWNDTQLVEDVKDQVLLYLKQLYQNHSPEFIYYKTLFHIFEEFLAQEADSGLAKLQNQIVDTGIWNALFDFQKDGVKGAINKILKYNGCIIADSVGLGKTFEALAVIKYFELKNDKVLVLCPKKLRENWTVYQAHNNSELNPFVNDRFSYTVLSHTDLSRDTGYSGDVNLGNINWGNYDLVVIDESHNFRNNTPGKRDENGQIVRRSRYQRLMEDIIQSGVKTKVLLLSATPVNNDLKDLRNQLYFLTEGKDDSFRDTLGIVSLKDTLTLAQTAFSKWAKRPGEHHTRALLESLNSAFFKILDELSIARSRKHIKLYYKEALQKLGGFPHRPKPITLSPATDLEGLFMSYDKLSDEISNYQLSLFNPSKYVLAQYRQQYEVTQSGQIFKQSDREYYLIGMMKVNFMKRLESSVSSFAITMNRTISKIEELEKRLKEFQQYRSANTEFDLDSAEIEDAEDEELMESFEVGKKLIFKMAHLDVVQWLEDLQHDKRQLHSLYLSAKDVTPERDAKLVELKKLIEGKVRQPTTNKLGKANRKVLVFTAFADTADYLYTALQNWAKNELGINLALVSGGAVGNKTTFGNTEFNQILTNFSPHSKKRDKIPSMPQNSEIDLLIATDCISEGQNLQDCDYLVNYDIHWNPVRIIQRFGRIDRIGSINNSVQLVNFWPTQDLNKYINLKNRVESRMALVDISATNEDNLLAAGDLEELIEEDLKYRTKQLLKLREEVLDLEDFNEDSVALNDFTLEDFRRELANYIESNRQLLKDAPLGLYALVPPNPAFDVVRPGVIFCLKQKSEGRGTETINPLQPYYLIYIQHDGVVRLSFAQPKQILDMYRILCVDKNVPYEALCNLFDQQTLDGKDMTVYSGLLKSAVDASVESFRKRNLAQLQAGRSGRLVPQAERVQATSDFELISWLVIKDGNGAN